MPTTTRITPLHSEHVNGGARLVDFAGWDLPIRYSTIVAEHRAVRTQAGIFDVSHMGRIALSGAPALGLLDHCFTTDVAALADGQAQYTIMCGEDGGILDDCVLYRLAAKRFLLVCNASNRAKVLARLREAARQYPTVVSEDVSDSLAMIAVQGPRATAIVERALGPRLTAAVASFHCLELGDAAPHTVVARTGYTGEDGFEVLCPAEDAVRLWRAFLADGATPCGLGARDTLRLEAALHLYGNDMDETRNPYEAGLGRLVALEKPAFCGREALARLHAAGPPRRLIAFVMRGREIARHGYTIGRDGCAIGTVTSGGPGIWVERNIGLGYVETALAGVGTAIDVALRGAWAPAAIVRRPFYRRGAPEGNVAWSE